MRIAGLILFSALLCSHHVNGQKLHVASLGDFKLTSGEVIEDCKLSYRIFGKLNEARTNGVLVPTWFNGNTEGWVFFLGKEGYIDTIQFAAISIDAFGSGLSSSPSDLKDKAGEFPLVSIRDMVNSQHQLLIKQLKIPSLHAVVGISMGGMQAFEWGSAYPTFVNRIVSIEGTPKLSAYDLVAWGSILETLSSEKKYGVNRDSAALQYARLFFLLGSTPSTINAINPENLQSELEKTAVGLGKIPFENASLQVRAMINHDISKPLGNDMNRVHQNFKSKLLVVGSYDDHVVAPQPALNFAKAIAAETLVLQSPCGHQVFSCEKTKIGEAIRNFLIR